MTSFSDVSILISTKDRARLLERTLKSIRSYAPNVEIIVGDDHSQDDTESVCRRHGAEWFDTGLVEYTHCGGAGVINQAFQRARGDVIVQQNAEVVHLTDCLTPLAAAVRGTQQIAAFATVFDGPASFLDFSPDYTQNFSMASVRCFCGLARPVPWFFLGATSRAGFRHYRTDLPGAADVELATRMAKEGYSFQWLTSAVGYHQDHPRPPDPDVSSVMALTHPPDSK